MVEKLPSFTWMPPECPLKNWKIQFHNSKRLENPLAEKIPSRRLHGEALLLLVEFPFFLRVSLPTTSKNCIPRCCPNPFLLENNIKYHKICTCFFSFRGKFRFYFLDLQQLCHLAAFLPTSELNRTIDSEKLARALDKAWRSAYPERPLGVMVQVNSSGEETKMLGPWKFENGTWMLDTNGYVYMVYIYICEYIYICTTMYYISLWCMYMSVYIYTCVCVHVSIVYRTVC